MTQITQISRKDPDELTTIVTEYLMGGSVDQGRIINIVYNPNNKLYTAFMTVDTDIKIEVPE